MDCLEGIREAIRSCCSCDLCKTRTQPVPPETVGSPKVFFVGEAPGREEDLQGRPFVGRAGKLLREAMEEAGFKEYHITNVVKCRPPNNRTPKSTEIEICKRFLIDEVKCLKPELLVALGKTAMKGILGFDVPLKEARGKVYKAKLGGISAKVLVTYHPAAVLRRRSLKEEFFMDIKKAYNMIYKQGKLF
ncbi:DNA polymerase [Ignicoccus pacificus DSM 13166]|uniref:Type-4 uracil-DNA glycosylase n=1 Tax=Ignicoccus pacificus DSM 13166 TaxID=940294 RepID=A0A977PKA0_9CREN|nr:DNA polymerase [Ignicoccus pacificus DSM 13166]